jgi:Ca-activated chloride channel homolog
MSEARHRARRTRWTALVRRRRLAAGTALVTVGAAAGGVVLAGWQTTATPGGCGGDEPPFVVAAAPEIAPVVTQVVAVLASEGGISGLCSLPVVRAQDPFRTARAIAADPDRRPDVWVPDSSLWPRRLPGRGVATATELTSVASSPLVLAVPGRPGRSAPAEPLSVAGLLPSGSSPARWLLPDPRRSSAGVAALLMARDAVAGDPDRAELLATLLRGAEIGAGSDLRTALARRPETSVAVATTEQRVAAHLGHHPRRSLALAYPERPAAADYPFVVLADAPGPRSAADHLLRAMQGPTGRALLAQAGFRDPLGVPGEALTALPQVDAGIREPMALRPGPARSVLDAVRAIRQPSRLLAILDVSGSMASPVPGAGATRMDLAVRALLTGLATYPDDTLAGLWTFSTDLTPTADHAELVAPLPLGPGADGTSGRARLAAALNEVRVVPYGGTGLYDTVLASVRAARAGWRPGHVNSVVLVTDGADEDSDSIGLDGLLRTLRAERDRSRPVSLFAFAYGPAADHASLSRIVAVTGGVAYRALDPRDLGSVIADGIGRRAAPAAGSPRR